MVFGDRPVVHAAGERVRRHNTLKFCKLAMDMNYVYCAALPFPGC